MGTSGRTSTATSCFLVEPHVPRHPGASAEGHHQHGASVRQGQGHRSAREKVLCLDRRIHSRFPHHFPADVDRQGGVRRERTLHCSQKVLLRRDCGYRGPIDTTRSFDKVIAILTKTPFYTKKK